MRAHHPVAADIVDDVVERFASEMPQIDPQSLETVCRLIAAGRKFEHSAAAMLKEFGFNYTDFDVLGMLRTAGSPYEMTPADLLRYTMITSGSMTTCLDRLERAGMVRRRTSETDRRVRVISLTAKGKSTIEKALEIRFETAARTLFASLNENQLKALNNKLRRIQEA